MKYIRTKDGKILKGSNYGFGVGMPYKNYDVKVADTIEELCDEFVIKAYCSNEPFLFMKEQMDIKDFISKCEKDTIIYGAIWTDKGLIYVAKMNEKGELELL